MGSPHLGVIKFVGDLLRALNLHFFGYRYPAGGGFGPIFKFILDKPLFEKVHAMLSRLLKPMQSRRIEFVEEKRQFSWAEFSLVRLVD